MGKKLMLCTALVALVAVAFVAILAFPPPWFNMLRSVKDTASSLAQGPSLSGSDLYNYVRNYTVYIRGWTTKKDNAEEGYFNGSGFVWKEGDSYYVLTAHHVVSGSQDVLQVQFYGQKKFYEVKKLGWDPMFDLAVLTLTDKSAQPSDYATLGNSDKLNVGDALYVLGNPSVLKFLWFEGVLSSGKAYIPGKVSRFLAADVTCNPGNSGGLAVDRAGRVVGFVDAIMIIPHPICLITPVNAFKVLWPKMKAGGEVKHGVLGIAMANAWELKPDERKGLTLGDEETGVVAVEILPDSPAAKAEIKKGDILLGVSDILKNKNYEIGDVSEFIEWLNLNFYLDDEAVIKIRRGEDYLVRRVRLADGTNFIKMPQPPAPALPPLVPPTPAPNQPVPAPNQPAPGPFPNQSPQTPPTYPKLQTPAPMPRTSSLTTALPE